MKGKNLSIYSKYHKKGAAIAQMDLSVTYHPTAPCLSPKHTMYAFII